MLLFTLGASCEKIDRNAPANLFGGRPVVIGHGGLGFPNLRNGIPANTIQSIARAIEGEDAAGVEIDVRLSNDSVLVAIHRMRLEEETNCFGCVDSLNVNDIINCKYGKTSSSGLGSYTIPTVELIYQHFADWDPLPWISLNVKTNVCGDNEAARLKTFAKAVHDIVKKHSAVSRTIIESPSIDFLKEVQALDPNLLIMLDSDDFENHLPLICAEGWDGIVSRLQNISAEDVQDAHAVNKYVVVYGVKLRQDAVRAVNYGVDMMQTDDIRMANVVVQSF